MRKEEIEQFLDKVPFKIITRKGTVMTCCDVIKLNDDSLTFRDKFNSTVITDLDGIDTIQSLNISKGVSGFQDKKGVQR